MAQAQSDTSVTAEFQAHLSFLGFEPGGIDGQMGGGTRSAIRLFQLQNGLAVTGRPNSRTQQALFAGVNRKLTERFGRSLNGEYGTSAACRISTARYRIKGLHVQHLPTWTDQTFDYMLLPADGNRFRIVWEASNRLDGQFVQYDQNSEAFRVPELNMIALSKCDSQSGDSANTGFQAPSVPSVPSTALGSVEDELESLGRTLSQAQTIRETIRAKLDSRNGSFGSMSAQIASLEANLNTQQLQADDLRQKLRRERRQNRGAKDQHDQTLASLTAMTGERDQLLEENSDLLRVLNNNSQGGNGRARAKLRAENAALKIELQRLTKLLQAQGAVKQKDKGLIFQSNDGRFQFSLGGR